jgi:gliding motility-associated-like protein/uncharacterized repeat protein (TIGR01451 family)
MKEHYLKKEHSLQSLVKNTLLLIVFIFGISLSVTAQNCTVNAGILNETICANDALTLQGNNPSPIIGTVQWTQVSGPAVIINSPNTPSTTVTGYTGGNTYVFRYSATCGDGNPAFQDKTVVVQPITIANAGANIASCPNASGTLTVTGNTPQNPGETGEWVIVGGNPAGVVINFPDSPTSTITLPQTSCGTTTLSWTITGPEYAPGQFCQTTSSITITNYGGGTPVSAGTDQTLSNCYTATQSTNLNGSFGGCGLNGQAGTWTFVSGPNNPTITSPNSANSSVTNLIEGAYVFRWTVAGPCVSGSDEVTITVPAATQDVTTLPGGTVNTYFCDNTITQATLEGETPLYAGETVLWTQTGGAPATIVSPTNPTTLVTGLSDSGDPYTFTYTLTNANTGCTFSKNYVINYSGPTRTIEANGGNNIFGTCNQTAFSIPLVTTGTGSNRYRILSGPAGSPLAPFPTVGTGVGNTLNITLTYPGTYIIQFVRTEDGNLPVGCDYGFDSIAIVVSGDPTPSNAGSDVNLDCGVTTAPLSGVAPTIGLSAWSQLSGPNQAVIADHFATNTTASGLISGTYVFQYITKGGGTGCALSIDTVTVNVSSSLLSTPDAGIDQSVCRFTPVTLAGSAPQPGETGQWSQVGGPNTVTFSDVNDPNATATGFDALIGTYTLRWTISYTNPGASGCSAPVSDDVDIDTTIEAGPTIAQAGTDACYPSGTTIIPLNGNAPAGNESGLWTVTPSAGVTFDDATLPNANAIVPGIGSYTFTWTISKNLGSCQPTADSVVVTVADTPAAGAGPDQNVCSTTVVMAATVSSGAQGTWSRVSGFGSYTISDINDPAATFTFEFSGVYVFRWTVEAGQCSTAFDDVQLIVGIPPVTANAGPNQDICTATTAVLDGSPYDDFFETGEWSLLAGAPNIPTIANAADPNTAISNLVAGTYTFRWSVASKGNFLCPSSFDDVVIQVAPPANAGSDQTHCDVTSVQLVAGTNSTGTWTQTAGPASTITQSPANSNVANATVIPGNNYTFQFTTATFNFTSGGTCAGSADIMDVVVFDGSSIPPAAGPDQTVCIQDVGGIVTLAGNTPPGDVDSAEWRWVFQPTGSVASITSPASPGTTVTNLTVPGLYILQWVFVNASCRDLSDIVRINVYEAPSTANAGSDDTVACQQSYITNAVAPTAGIGTWTFAPGGDPSAGAAVIDSPNNPQTTLSNVTTLGTYTLLWTVTNGPFTNPSLCQPSTDTVSITFNDDPPSTADAGPDQELCAATQTNLAAVPLTSGLGTWTQTSGTPANIASPNAPNTLVFGLTTGLYEFTWTATTVNNDGCSSQDVMQIEIFATPSAANAGPDQVLPQFSPVTMAATVPTVGTGSWSQISGPSTVSFTNSTSPTTTVAGTTAGTYVFQWNVTNGNCVVSTDQVTAQIISIVDLELTKSVLPTSAVVGNPVTFTISVFNNNALGGSVNATGVGVRDVIPAGYTLVPGTVSNGGVYNPGDFSITWSNLAIADGATQNLTFNATVNATGGYINTAQIIDCNQIDNDSTPNNDDGDQSEDDEDNAQVTPIAASTDLSLTKTVVAGNTTPLIGAQVSFEIVITNNGPLDATGVQVVDLLPSGYDFVNFSSSAGLYNDATGLWDVGTVDNGTSESLIIDAIVLPTGDYFNIAQVTASDLPDPDSAPNNDDGDQSEDDEDNAVVVPVSAVSDLSLTKNVNNLTPLVGSQVIFTIQIANAGPQSASSIVVNDDLPAGYTYVSHNATAGVFNPVTGLWQINSIVGGGGETLQVTAIVNASGPYLNIAEVTNNAVADSDSTPNNGVTTEDDYASAATTPTALSADLSLTKIIVGGNASPVTGSQITFEIAVLNSGPQAATGIQVTDLLPTGYTFVSYAATGGVYNNATGVWTIGGLGANAFETLQVTATVNATGNYINVAQVIASNQPDPDSTPANGITTEDDYASVTVTPVAPQVDIELTKDIVAGSATPLIGSQITFGINVSNTGTQNATGIQVTDLLPTGYAFVSYTATTGTYNSVTGLWSIGTLGAGYNETLQVTATVNATGNYENIAEVTACNQTDIDSTPNNGVTTEDDYDSVIIIPTAQAADLSLTKSVNNTTPLVGSQVIFTITAANAGPNITSGVTVTDLLPSGYTFISANATQGGYNAGTGVWTVGSMANGASEIIQITATVNATGVYLNTAQVTASSLPDPDSTVNNGAVLEDDYATATTTPTALSADLSLTKTLGDNTSPLIGGQITFNVTVANAGPQDAAGVTVIDALPTGYTFVSSNATQGNYNPTTGIWTVGNVGNGDAETLLITVTVNVTGNYQNIAEVSASSLPDLDSTPGNAVTTEDDYATIATTPTALSADLSLTKVVNNATPLVGSQVTFTITVTNGGPNTTNGVTVTDLLPTGYAFVSANATQGGYNAGTGVWTVGNMVNGVSEILQINATVNAAGVYLNSAEVTASSLPDPDSTANNGSTTEDDDASATTTPTALSADLSLTKTVNNAVPIVGSQVIFTITVANAGPNSTTGVTITDLLPTGYTYVSATTTQGAYSSVTGLWTIGAMTNGASEILQITATVNSTGIYLNTAEVTASSITDPDSSVNNGITTEDDYASVTTTPILGADLSLTKIVVGGITTPLVGSQITFNVTVSNAGQEDATGVTVTDMLPTGYTFVSSNATQGSYNPGTGIWTVGTVLRGDSETLQVTVTVNATGNYENIAEVATSNQTDPDSTPGNTVTTEDDYASVITTPTALSADLSLTKTVNNATPLVSSQVIFTLTVASAGPDTTSGVTVTDLLPTGYTFVSANATQGSYTAGTGVWTVGTMTNGASEVLQIIATVNAAGTYLNTAQVTASSLPDTDSTVNNGAVLEDDYATAVTVPTALSADLSLTKTVNNATPLVGSQVIFTVTVISAGPDTTNGVTVTDLLPTGYAFVSENATQGSYTAGTGVWTVGTMTNGASEVLQITATVNAAGTYLNTAEVTASSLPDPDSTPGNIVTTEDDYAALATTPTALSADLSLTKVVNNATPLVGSQITFTLTVTNGGPNTTNGVTVTDLLPSGYAFVSANATQGGYNAGTGVWTVGSMVNGVSEILQITATVNSTGTYLNTAEVTASSLPDPDSTANNGSTTEDDDASATTTPTALSADLSLTKTVNNATPLVGSLVIFTITTTNSGPDTTAGVTVSDLLPTGYTFVSANATQGSYTAGTGVWTVGTMTNGASEVLQITATVNATGTYLNTAEVTASSLPDPDSTVNNAAVLEDDYATAITVPTALSADLSITKTIIGGNTTPLVGSQISFEVVINNAGPDTASGVQVTDLLPTGYTYTIFSATAGSYSSATGLWNIGTMTSGSSETLIVTATVNAAGNYENIAEVTASSLPDPDSAINNGVTTEDDYASVVTVPIPVSADLSITKTVGNPTPLVGSGIVFTIVVTNNGPQDATGIQVLDQLPSGYSYIVATTTTGVYNPGTGIWNIGTIVNGASETLLINASVLPTGNYLNIAEITTSSLPDPDSTPGNNNPAEDDYASVSTAPIAIAADLSLTKTVNNPAPLVGTGVTFELIITNNGPQGATGVEITDLLPSGYNFVLASSTAGIYNSATGVWIIGALASGASETLLINGTVLPAGNYLNVAEVTASNQPDPDSTVNNGITTEDDYASAVTVPVAAAADLSLAKTIVGGITTPLVGTQIIFNVTVSNAGPQPATGVLVTDILPAGYTFVSYTATEGAYNAGTGVWDISSAIASGTSETLQITVLVNAAGPYLNTAEITSSNIADPDSTPNNGIITEDDYTTAITFPTTISADLSLTKTVNKPTPLIGSAVTFEVIVTNNGPQAATNVQLTDQLPSGYAYVLASTTAGIYNSATGVWAVGTLANGASESLLINATVLSTGNYLNIAEITTSNVADPDSTPGNGVTTEDDYASAVTAPVAAAADLSLTKTIVGGSTTPLVGTQMIFNVTVSNAGPQPATGVLVTDILPAGYTFVSYTATEGAYNAGTGVWDLSSAIVSGTSETLQVTVVVNGTGPYLNSAEITASNIADPDSTPNNGLITEDDYASIATVPIAVSADLSLTKTVNNATPAVSTPVTFEVIITNNGPQNATGVQVTDQLPSGYAYVLASTTAGIYNSATGVWVVGNLASGASETMLINGIVQATGNYLNIAEVSASNLPDPDSTPNNGVATEDDYASAITAPVIPMADLSLVKTIVGGNSSPLVGTQIIFDITLSNGGPQSVTNVQVSDLLPSGYTFVSYNATEGVYNGVTGLWSIGSVITSGTSHSLQVTAIINAAGNYLNVAEITASSLPDPDSTVNNGVTTEDDYSSIITTPIPVSADLSLTKTVNNATPLVGASVTFEVIVINNGPQATTGVQITDLLPSGYTYVLASSTAGTYNAATGLWNIGSLANGASETLLINATVNVTGNYVNIAQVSASGLPDLDSTPGNNIATEDDQASAIVTPITLVADLSLTKTVIGGDLTPLVGSQVSFEIVVSNAGPQTASGVQVTDLLPTGYTYAIHNATAGNYNSTTGVWNIGTLFNSDSETLIVTATVNAAGSHINTAEITASSLPDPDSTPNNGVATEDDFAGVTQLPIPLIADLSLQKTVVGGNLNPIFGSTITFQVTVTNNGPQDATGVKVIDLLPSGYEYLVFSSTAGTYNQNTGIWNIGTIINDATETLLMTVKVIPGGNYLNIAEIFESNRIDPNSTPNNGNGGEDDLSSVVLSPVLDIADLSVTKEVLNNQLTPLASTHISFVVTVSNSGPGTASGVVLRDLLPSGYDFDFYNATSGTYDEATGEWNVGIVLQGGTETLIINVVVNYPTGTVDEYLNEAEVIALNQSDPDSTPDNGVTTEDDYASIAVVPVVPTADLSITKTVNNATPLVGSSVTFEIIVTSNGPQTTHGVQITDLLPSGYAYVLATATSGVYNSTTGVWTISSMAEGISETLLVNAIILPTGDYLNIAEVTASSLPDPDSTPANGVTTEDDYASVATIPVPTVADLSLTKTVNNPTPVVGSSVTFEIVVTNDGPQAAIGVAVTDLLPSGYLYVLASATTGVYNNTTGVWQVGTLANGFSETLLINAIVLAGGDHVNTAEVTSSVIFDPDSTPGNNIPAEDDQASASVVPIIQSADLSLTKTIDNAVPVEGEQVTFEITVANDGPQATSGVQVVDLLPSGYAYVISSTTSGTYNPSTGLWNIGTIIDGGSQTLLITATVLATGNYLNIAQVIASGLPDPDSTPNNDDGDQSEDDEDSVTIVVQSTDIAITKDVDVAEPLMGANVVFTITAGNLGTTSATNIEVMDILPTGYELISAIVTSGTYDSGSGLWEIPTINAGSQQTMTVTVKVVDKNDYLNTATLTNLDQIDTNAANDSDSAEVHPKCLKIYNEFSPNDDGDNDTFHIDCIENYPNNVLEIFNRWGDKVYSRKAYDNSWDGTSDGPEKTLPVGTYFYILDLADGSDKTSGWLYIKR